MRFELMRVEDEMRVAPINADRCWKLRSRRNAHREPSRILEQMSNAL